MGRTIEPKITSRQRLNRGLRYTAAGPVDITRGVVGVSAHGVESAASAIKRRAREARAVRDGVAKEAEAVKHVVAELPHVLAEIRRAQHRRRLFIFGLLGMAVVAGGAVAFSITRRSATPEPSTLPPSVDVAPKI
ncbi:cell wall synthesis protein CwsA [Mycolicibacterium sarraceniae]|uniref:Cell wall synthesis protein CwsA n=1 Tax=Mycolicibacterium sarraceniae TaxID=1534348 RepID=A0A7I7SPJ6_9MYCO|nr:cell wall synthesis protein CwsA [Mycolicibacterium sarraceniae]BBY58460.1 cell wall synthesis protein CwsA [Mycolicibacterium sarraceniae]